MKPEISAEVSKRKEIRWINEDEYIYIYIKQQINEQILAIQKPKVKR